MTKIRFKLAPKPTKAEKAALGKTGFVPVATRWVIEHSNAWMERCKNSITTLSNMKSCVPCCVRLIVFLSAIRVGMFKHRHLVRVQQAQAYFSWKC